MSAVGLGTTLGSVGSTVAGKSFSLGSLFKAWSLTRIEPPGEEEVVEGQFPAEDVRESGSATFAEVGPPSSTSPVQQFIKVGADTLSGRLTFCNTALGVDTENDIDLISSWRYPHPRLGRPALVVFACGSTHFTGFLKQVGKSRQEQPMLDGRWFITVVDIEIVRVDRFDTRYKTDFLVDPTKALSRSRYKPIPDGATYEDLAKTEYGTALVGTLIRQDALDAFPSAGANVLLPDRAVFADRYLIPDSFMFSEHETAIARRNELFALRSGTYRVPG